MGMYPHLGYERHLTQPLLLLSRESSLSKNEVGHRKHDIKTDPWIYRRADQRYTWAEENHKWLETHRAYLLVPEIGDRRKAATTIPSFPPGRTIVVWALGKAVGKREFASNKS
jgi:hypothetical protein